MFTCPKCGGSTFRSSKRPDGSYERECAGTMSYKQSVALVKEVVGRKWSPQAGGQVLQTRAVAGQPVAERGWSRPCVFMWPASEDASYGVGPNDVNEPAGSDAGPTMG